MHDHANEMFSVKVYKYLFGSANVKTWATIQVSLCRIWLCFDESVSVMIESNVMWMGIFKK